MTSRGIAAGAISPNHPLSSCSGCGSPPLLGEEFPDLADTALGRQQVDAMPESGKSDGAPLTHCGGIPALLITCAHLEISALR